MRSLNTTRNIILAAALAVMPLAAQAPDNTKANKGSQDPGAVTADKQGMSKADTEMTKKIRKSIMDDKSLSTYARNVKIVTREGSVTVKGPVRTEEDKTVILKKAKEIAGEANVKDEITIAPAK